jgi:hypothetical protein
MKITPAPQIALVWVTCLAKRLPYTGQHPVDRCWQMYRMSPLQQKEPLDGAQAKWRGPPSLRPSVPIRPNPKQETWPLGWHSPAGNSPKTRKQIWSARPERGSQIAVLLGIATDEWVQVAWINVAPFDLRCDQRLGRTSSIHPECLTNIFKD